MASGGDSKDSHEGGFIFLVPPKGHEVYTLTKIKKEPYTLTNKSNINPDSHEEYVFCCCA